MIAAAGHPVTTILAVHRAESRIANGRGIDDLARSVLGAVIDDRPLDRSKRLPCDRLDRRFPSIPLRPARASRLRSGRLRSASRGSSTTQYIPFRSLRTTNVAVRHGATPIPLDCFTDDPPLQGADIQRTATCLGNPSTTTHGFTSPKTRSGSSTALGKYERSSLHHASRLRVRRKGRMLVKNRYMSKKVSICMLARPKARRQLLMPPKGTIADRNRQSPVERSP